MKRSILFIIALLILVGFFAYAMTYSVRFTEAAVVTRLGEADERSVVREAGLKFKWPTPIETVTTYDTRARFIEPEPETFSTADQVQLVVQGFLTWRVDDPLLFYQRHRGEAGSNVSEHYRVAENNLRSIFRSALSAVSGFERSELFSPELGGTRLAELEQAIKRRMTATQDEGGADVGSFGIAIDLVGITSLELPESVTEQVFTLMQSERAKIAEEARSQGEALAATIRAEGETDALRIIEFANTRAAELINLGEQEAAVFLAAQAENPELAQFLQQIELMKEGLGRRTTLILPTTMYGMDLFDPNWLGRFIEPRDNADGRGGTR